MKFKRSSGILLHPTSLPGPYGIGEVGSMSKQWLNFLDRTGCGLWQVLPLGPTGFGDSPYQCFSAFAGNPYLISIESLVALDLLNESDLNEIPDFPANKVDFGSLIPWKISLLNIAFQNFKKMPDHSLRSKYEAFKLDQAGWLHDFTLFMALKESYGGGSWIEWPKPIRERNPEALAKSRLIHAEAIEKQSFNQFLFFSQWEEIRKYASEKEILIIGDIPIFVSHDSADVWANPDLFYLDNTGKPTVVAGVPPDYFSETGQLWGNPLYRWEVHKASGYAWWLERLKAVLSLVDIVRLDHFRGFSGYWEIPGDAKTAQKGRWVPGPGADLFNEVRKNLGSLPIIAEDLGVITSDVTNLRLEFDLPGMKILQFAFASDAKDPFLPHNYENNCVVYTGTHDNDTARGWYERVSEEEKHTYRRYFDRDGSNAAWDLIRGVWASVAVFGLAPMQDFLNLGNEARMNYPGNPSGNWSWRMSDCAMSDDLVEKIADLNTIYARTNHEKATKKPSMNAVVETSDNN